MYLKSFIKRYRIQEATLTSPPHATQDFPETLMSSKIEADENAFNEDDIFFDCPHCGKSMAIDKRGMGMTVQCPDCGGLVKVPTLTEAEAEDGDNVGLPAEAMEEALEESRHRVKSLAVEIESLRKAKDSLESLYRRQEMHVKELRGEFANIQSALDHISLLLLPVEDGEDGGEPPV